MQPSKCLWVVVALVVNASVLAQWESGSDGTDGDFTPPASTMIDLSLAATMCDCDGGGTLNDPCRWDCPSPDLGKGVYDAQNWVVVYKYTTISVPSGATITFGMHPSGAPVVWLATGTVTINGRVNLDGEDGVAPNPLIIPYFTRPGPGGFEGAQADHSGAGSKSYGLGPGSSPTNTNVYAGGASHATVPGATCIGTAPTGSVYGDPTGIPLRGGSGGNQDPDSFSGAGGAGGGAILIAAPLQVTLGPTGSVTAQGGDTWPGDPGATGAGSGGTIRIRAQIVTLAAGSQIVGRGGLGIGPFSGGNLCGFGGDGRVRIEASTVNNAGTINGSQSFPGAPSVVFPASPPRLFVTSICGQSVSSDPMWGIKTADVNLNSATACPVVIGSSGVPAGTIAQLRVVPARGNISTHNSGIINASGVATVPNVTFPAGRSEIQLRANW